MKANEPGPCPECGSPMSKAEGYEDSAICYDADSCNLAGTIIFIPALRILQRNAAMAKAGERLRDGTRMSSTMDGVSEDEIFALCLPYLQKEK